MKHFTLALVGLACLSTVAVSAQDPKQIDAGKQLYSAKQCAKCHQIAGKGNKANKLDGVASKLSPAEMKKWLISPAEMEAKLEKKPKLKMSSKKIELKGADLDAMLAYLETLK